MSTVYPHIVKTDGEPARLERMKRLRVAQLVMDYLTHGWSPDEMCRQYPHLLPAEVHAAMSYYFDHQEEIEKEIEAEVQEDEEARKKAPPSPFLLKLKKLGLR